MVLKYSVRAGSDSYCPIANNHGGNGYFSNIFVEASNWQYGTTDSPSAIWYL